MADKQNEWFEDWFDTIYYHILYKKRNDEEAAQFLDNLISFLSPSKDSKFLDLACGKGRHSIYLSQKGFDVTGIDLSENSIETASKLANDKLQFIVHDMREHLPGFEFDFVLNLFTSFGYFENPDDDKTVINMVNECLKPSGIFVLDYFNFEKPHKSFEIPFSKTIDSISFEIKKRVENSRIIKDIIVRDKDKVYQYSEQVRIYKLDQFKELFDGASFNIITTFGNYQLEPYDEQFSERLILVAQKMGT